LRTKPPAAQAPPAKPPKTRTAPKRPAPQPAARVAPSPAPRPVPPPPPPVPRRQAASHVNWLNARLRGVAERGEVERFWRTAVEAPSAWMASLAIHLVALIVLANLMVYNLEDPKPPVQLVLSTQTNGLRGEGCRKAPRQEDPIEF